MEMIFLGGEIDVTRHLVNANPISIVIKLADASVGAVKLISSSMQTKQKKLSWIFSRKKSFPLPPLLIDGRRVEIVQNVKFRVSVISNNLEMGAKY